MRERLLGYFLFINFVIFTLVNYGHTRSAYFSGGSAFYTGRAGTGVSGISGDFSLINPASLALLERFNLSINYSSLDRDYIFPLVSAGIPTSYGVIGLSYSSFSPGEDQNIRSYFYSAGLAKEVTTKFLFGLSAVGGYSNYDEKDYFAGINPGFIYRLDGTSGFTGFGFFNPAIGLSVLAGFASGEEIDLNSVTAGYSFDFYMSRNYTLGFYNDISAIDGYSAFPVKFGMEAVIINSFFLRLGAVVPDAYDYMTYTGGAGYRYSGDTFSVMLNYALSYSVDNGMSHFAGLTLEYGALDREPPELRIEPDYTYISPNHDGVQDFLIFSTSVRDKSRIRGWKLQITDDRDTIVKEFKMSDREIEDRITLSGFFKRLVSTKDSLVVPENIFWDGTGNSGSRLPDGKYKYYFYAWDSRDNIAPVKSGIVAVDNVSPSVEVSADSMIFSPNGDRNKDILVIHQKIQTSKEDAWTGEIKNSDGQKVATFQWDGDTVPERFVWNGLTDSGEPFPDGLYYYNISSTDKAGNSASAGVREITLITKMEVADVRFENEYFSYLNNKKQGMRFFPDVSSVKGIERWEVTVTGKGDDDAVVVIGGIGTIPAYIDWNCLNSEGKKLDDGEYEVRFSAWYSSGNNPVSFPKRFVIDSRSPECSISHDPDIFSPDGDGENDYLTFNLSSADKSGIGTWEIQILSESGLLFRKFSGKGEPPRELKWDGIGSGGDVVESASDYEVKFVTTDHAGNVSEKVSDRISVDILVVVTERGLKMRISNIEFAFGSSTLGKRGKKILDRVSQILEKYKKYNVVVEGHTDDLGDEEFNLKLSEKRALAVRNYLVDRGTEPGRLRSIGMGESLPFYPNTTDENRRRNRRVEFLLEKIKEER